MGESKGQKNALVSAIAAIFLMGTVSGGAGLVIAALGSWSHWRAISLIGFVSQMVLASGIWAVLPSGCLGHVGEFGIGIPIWSVALGLSDSAAFCSLSGLVAVLGAIPAVRKTGELIRSITRGRVP
jgi:hypothetical protein